MTKHLADHRTPSQGARVQHFLRIARDRSETIWRDVFRRAAPDNGSSRRVVEYARIERQPHD
ncbi:MAG: hypothetical protein I8H94_00470 [Rhodobacteraceae bacterium]|nr:hypothetical protein [Paracoccaceae bacterium]